ncbi:MAG: cupin domain-containing protein [Candidatus Bathyarchaeia archaeon]
MAMEVKILKAYEVPSVQPLKPGCHERWLFDAKTPTENGAMVMAVFEPGKESGLHQHGEEEFFFILRGRGKAQIAGRTYELEPDVCIYVPAETPHNFINTSNCESLTLLAFFSKNQFQTTQLA